ncbi:MAG: M23 family metallopeptidase [Minisyncoccia bacterium]
MKTEYGQFRSIEMNDLAAWASSPLWDDEECGGEYLYPVRIDPRTAEREGAKLAVGNPPDETYRLGHFFCASSPHTHQGPYRHAIDFLVPDGTPVVAVDEGIVIEVQEHSDTFGDGPEFRGFLNHLTIQHDNGEFSQYCHLAKNSPAQHGIFQGLRVTRGQPIAAVGKTGWTDRDHLHFIVFRAAQNESPFTFKSLKIRFS